MSRLVPHVLRFGIGRLFSRRYALPGPMMKLADDLNAPSARFHAHDTADTPVRSTLTSLAVPIFADRPLEHCTYAPPERRTSGAASVAGRDSQHGQPSEWF